MNKMYNFAPDDETVDLRIKEWNVLFNRFENCNDKNDDGYDMDTIIAIAEAEDSDDFEEDNEPENISPEEEAIEVETTTINTQKNHMPRNKLSQPEEFKRLTYYFSPKFIKKASQEYQKRTIELGKKNLPYWNICTDERYQENISKFSDGYSALRNYELSSTASINQPTISILANPRQDSRFFTNPPQIPSFNPETFRLPPEIHQYIQKNSLVSVKIREYDLTVSRDPLGLSTINSVETLPALPSLANEESQIVEQSSNEESLNNSVNSKYNSPTSSSEQSTVIKDKPTSHKIMRRNSITESDVSTAGSSLSTEDDDIFFIGGETRYKQKRLNHRLKKMEKRRKERRKNLKNTIEAEKKLIITIPRVEVSETIDSSDFSKTESTADEDEFFVMIDDTIKKHNETIK